MKQLLTLFFVLFICPAFSEETDIVNPITSQHPRILLTDARVAELKALLKSDENLQTIVTHLETLGDVICTRPPVKRVLVGTKRFRLLGTSRLVLSRTLVLGTLYRLDGREKWKTRLSAELKAVCAFEDWYPTHFLDTAEMSAAVALGYDWLYHDLSPEERTELRDGLIKHGLEPGLKGGWWVKASNNWNQVCHGGMVLTALALATDRPDDCETLLASAKINHKSGLKAYAPAGVYPEGPGYWTYGTSFSVIMASALESVIGDDWGILDSPGFKESFDYRMHVQTPTGKVVNYADGGEGCDSSPYHFHLAAKTGAPGYSSFAMDTLKSDFKVIDGDTHTTDMDKRVNRLLALAVAWYVPETDTATPPLEWFAGGKSEVQVAFMRSAWNDRNALFASLKAGKLQVSHGHLDNGSFIIESDGVRWASDMGSEKEIYDRGDSWSTAQESHRWKFLRANNFGHNTLAIDGRIQRVAGDSPIVATGEGDSPFAVVDLSAAYAGLAKSVKRGIMMPQRKAVVIRDELTGVAEGKSVRWTMMVRTDIALSDDGRSATLKSSNRAMTVGLASPAEARFTVMSATPTMAIENQNSGWQRLVIDLTSEGGEQVISVVFVPAGAAAPKMPMTRLEQWQHAKGAGHDQE